jgi:16S rRNA (cytosine967-C5)-methyltransferase
MTPDSLAGHIVELIQLTDSHLKSPSQEQSPTAAPPADRTVSAFIKARPYLGAKDRRLISEYFYGIVRNRRYLEALLERYVEEFPARANLYESKNHYLALFAVYHFTKRPPGGGEFPESKWREAFPEAASGEFSSWLSNNRELEFLAGQPAVLTGVRHSFQDWMIEELTSQFGEDTEKLLAALNEPAPIVLRVNTLKSTRDQCRELLLSEGIDCSPSGIVPDGLVAAKRFNVEGTRAFKEGAFEMQDEGSQLVAIIAEPASGMTVIDACAGAGGKALHMSALMRNEGEIVAIDTEKGRLGVLERRAFRSGATNIKTLVLGNIVEENLKSKGDIVLIDAPCSGSGTIRRNPWFKWTISEKLVARYSGIQQKILSFNAQFVKPGGKLVYATCSFFRQENDDVVNAFLGAHPGFTNITSDLHLPGITITPSGGFIRLAPHILPTDGFTVCVLKLA